MSTSDTEVAVLDGLITRTEDATAVTRFARLGSAA